MLPNFRKSDTEPVVLKGPPNLPGNEAPSAPNAPVQVRPAVAVVRNSDRGAPSVIGPDLTIAGNLVSKGEVQVDGIVQGDIFGSHVIIGERATIAGGIVAEEIVIRGHVNGSVRGRRVMLQSTSHVEGDVYHQSLAIEQGAFFEGKSRRSDDPMAGVTRPDVAAPTPR